MAVTTDDIQSAARRVSSRPVSFSRRGGGVRDATDNWFGLIEQTSRVIVADPDVVLYFLFLATNRASTSVRSVVRIIQRMIEFAEGVSYKQPALPSTGRLGQAVDVLERRTGIDSLALQTLQGEATKYLRSAAPVISSRSRYTARGNEALTKYSQARQELLDAWPALRLLLSSVRIPSLPVSDLQEAATSLPVSNLRTAVDLELTDSNVTEHTVQVAAAVAAVRATGREFSLQSRIYVPREGVAFPEAAVLPSASGSPVSGLVLGEPAYVYGIRTGDLVYWGSGTATVVGVDDASLTLQDSTITESDVSGVFRITSPAYPLAEQATSYVRSLFSALPESDELQLRLTRLETASAGEIQSLVSYLANLHAQLLSLPSSTEQGVGRVGASYDAPETNMVDVLDSYSPAFAGDTVSAADAILDRVEEDGHDWAVELLLRANISAFLDLEVGATSRAGRVALAADILTEYTRTENYRGLGQDP